MRRIVPAAIRAAAVMALAGLACAPTCAADTRPVIPEELLAGGDTTVLTDFGDPNVIGSGLMYLTESTRARIWADWIRCPQAHMDAHVKWPAGDQGFLLKHLKRAKRWQNMAKVYSWKIHCKRGIPADADVVCFHGKPRPWNT